MGLKKISKLIEKINVLHDSLLSIDDEISSIEKDLLLNYIRQLYEQVLEIGSEEVEVKKVIPVAKKVIELPAQEEVVIQPPVEEIVDIPSEDSFKVPPQIPRSSGDNHSSDQSPIAVQTSGIQEVEQVQTPTIKESSDSEKEEIQVLDEPVTMAGLNQDLLAMFEMKEAKELSEKLSSTPIKDLNTAMGINDRFLTVNELFGGDANAFKECVDRINQMENYEDAKSYLLSETAQTFDWSSAERLKKAAGFITLVQRRFR